MKNRMLQGDAGKRLDNVAKWRMLMMGTLPIMIRSVRAYVGKLADPVIMGKELGKEGWKGIALIGIAVKGLIWRSDGNLGY